MQNLLIEYSPELLTLLGTGKIPGAEKWDKKYFEEIIEKIYTFFPELLAYRILIYLTHRQNGIINRELASMFPLRYPNSAVTKYEDLSSMIRKFKVPPQIPGRESVDGVSS